MTVDPAKKQDLKLIPTEDLKDWLRIERRALSSFLAHPRTDRKSVERAQWAKGRTERIEKELARRSGRLPGA